MKKEEMHRYEISGYYFADGERNHFDKIVEAKNNVDAIAKVMGFVAWHESLAGRTFKLDTIHYECL